LRGFASITQNRWGGIPAVAITTKKFTELEHDIAHTAKDVLELVDPAKLAETVEALRELVERLNQ
jgi:hypothetical protein